MSEASLWDYLSQGILPTTGHYSRIESETAQGFPDIHYTLNGQSGTIELKFARNPSRPRPFSGQDEGLRRSQIIWMEEEDLAGGVVLICAQVADRIYLLDGSLYRDDFNQFTVADLQRVSSASWTRGKDYPTKFLESILEG